MLLIQNDYQAKTKYNKNNNFIINITYIIEFEEALSEKQISGNFTHI